METETRPKSNELEPFRLTARGSAEPRCTVGLLTWNAGEDGVHCVASLLDQSEADLSLLWIDNASADGTAERIRARFPDLPEPKRNASNHGFCAPHNRMIKRCATRYYLALNQDVVLAPDYVQRLCDWLDESPEIAMASGVMLRSPSDPVHSSPGDAIGSAGLAFPRTRRHFHLGNGRLHGGEYKKRRIVAGIEGAAMLLRVEACRKASLLGNRPFAQDFFAYYEEIDLAHRFARIGFTCGVDGNVAAVHRGKGSGGFSRSAIRACFFANHWLTTLRNEPRGLILRELPYLLRGELQYWLPEYLAAPSAFIRALGILLLEAGAARKFYRAFEAQNGPTLAGLLRYRAQALEDVRRDRANPA